MAPVPNELDGGVIEQQPLIQILTQRIRLVVMPKVADDAPAVQGSRPGSIPGRHGLETSPPADSEVGSSPLYAHTCVGGVEVSSRAGWAMGQGVVIAMQDDRRVLSGMEQGTDRRV